jgi:hypothetical protein
MKSVLGLNFFVFSLLVLFLVLYFSKEARDEGFDNTGALIQLASSEAFDNTGALTQLETTRVVSKREQDIDDQIYDNLTRQGIINMTESGYKGTDYASTASEY